jgi:HIV Tat-specific factor 1
MLSLSLLTNSTAFFRKLEWFDEDAEAAAKEEAKLARWAKIVVLKNMFTAAEVEADPLGFPVELSDEIREECQERLGIEECSVQLVEEQPGSCTVKFKSELEALAVVKLMHGRWFDGRRVEATLYDGSFALPKKKLLTQTEDEEARLEQFSKYIEGESQGEESEEGQSSQEEHASQEEENFDD